jgi:hypothetical protein
MKRLLILSLVLVGFIACKRQNMARTANARSLGKGDPTSKPYSTFNPATQPAVESSEETTADVAIPSETQTPQIVYRFLVSFFSVASGPDNEGMRGFEEWVATYGNERKMTIAYDKISWGREGETEICFLLNSMTAEQQMEFITAANERLKTVKQVNTYENQPCKHQKRP